MLVPLRLVDGLVFLGEDLRFLLCQRPRVRRRIALLIESHGAASAPEHQPAD
jgi:hypothetical protein